MMAAPIPANTADQTMVQSAQCRSSASSPRPVAAMIAAVTENRRLASITASAHPSAAMITR